MLNAKDRRRRARVDAAVCGACICWKFRSPKRQMAAPEPSLQRSAHANRGSNVTSLRIVRPYPQQQHQIDGAAGVVCLVHCAPLVRLLSALDRAYDEI